jgi:hypothetical protein
MGFLIGLKKKLFTSKMINVEEICKRFGKRNFFDIGHFPCFVGFG